MRQCGFNMRVYVDKVDGTRTCCSEDAEIIALREQGIERTESILPGIVATGDICLSAESWFQRNGRKPVPGFRCHSPGPDIYGTETAKLPKRFIIEIPTGFRLSNGPRETRTDRVPHLLPHTGPRSSGAGKVLCAELRDSSRTQCAESSPCTLAREHGVGTRRAKMDQLLSTRDPPDSRREAARIALTEV